MDILWDVLAALAPINQTLRIIFGAAIGAVVLAAAARLLPEYAERKVASRLPPAGRHE